MSFPPSSVIRDMKVFLEMADCLANGVSGGFHQ